MTTEKSRYFIPGRSYDFQLKIKGEDYSQDMSRVRIVSTLTAAYQVVVLDIFVDPNDVILRKIYGQDPIKLSVRLLEQDGNIHEQIDFELMNIQQGSELPMKTQLSEGIQKDRTQVSLITVPREPFRTTATVVNDVFIARTLRQIIQELVIKNTGAKLDYDADGENTEVIDQVVIPPTTLSRSISYLDTKFGLYNNGPSNQGFVKYNNEITIRNLSSRMKKAAVFNVYQLSISGKTKDIVEKSYDGKNFYTYDNIYNSYSGNTRFSVFAKNLRHIVKPRDTLYYEIQQDLATVCAEYGLISKSPNTRKASIYMDSVLENRTRYYIEETGYEKTRAFANTMISKTIADLSTVSINLERNLRILNLMDVGQPVNFDTRVLEFKDLIGKYILKSSDLLFTREGEWQSIARIVLMRTNKTI